MSKTYRSDMMAAIHETAGDFHDAGLLDQRTLRSFDEMCLTPVQNLTPDQIREIRSTNRVSQAVLARYLNVSVSVISQWERGEKTPSGPALKLLTLVQRNGLETIA